MKTNSRAFVNQMLIWVIVTLCGLGSAGVGVVWMRHQISRTADNNRILRDKISQINRQLAEAQAMVENAQTLRELRARNIEFKLGLLEIDEKQLVHDRQEPGERLLAMRAKSNQELLRAGTLGDAPVPTTPVITFRVAQAQ